MKNREPDVLILNPSPLKPATDSDLVAVFCADHGYVAATCPGCAR